MHSLSILIIVFREAFSAPPVMLHASYSRLTFAELRVAIFKDVPRQFYVWRVVKIVSKNLARFVQK